MSGSAASEKLLEMSKAVAIELLVASASERGVAGSHAGARRRVALVGEIAEQGIVAAAAVDHVVAALAGQHVGRAVAGQPVVVRRTCQIFDRDVVSPPDPPPASVSLTPLVRRRSRPCRCRRRRSACRPRRRRSAYRRRRRQRARWPGHCR